MSHANDLRWYKESLQPCGVTTPEFRSLDFGFCCSSSSFSCSSSSSVTGLFSGPQVMILITGAHKAFALYKAIEEGVNHMWTVSAFQQHPRTVFVCDEDATLELKVKTVKYFKGEGRGWEEEARLRVCQGWGAELAFMLWPF